MSKVDNLNDLFIMEISDIYNAEKQLKKALPKMAKHASDPKLKKGFETHLAETEEQIEILEHVFEMCDIKPKRVTCEAMKGLIEEGSEAFDEFEAGPVLDCALIIAAQKVEHYEVSGYGSLCALAKKLGWNEAAEQLHGIMEQESETDEKLSQLAESINQQAYAQAA